MHQKKNQHLLPTSANNPTFEVQMNEKGRKNDEVLEDLEKLAYIVERIENPEMIATIATSP